MTTYNLAIITEEFYTNRIQNYLDVTSTTKWDKEMGHTISSQLNWVFSQNLFIDARLGYIARDFPIPYSDYAIADAPSLYDRYYGIYRYNPRYEETYIRHRFNPSVVATIFQDDLFGASHEIKIGAEYEYTDGNWDWWRQNPWRRYTYAGDFYAYTSSTYDNRGRVRCYTSGETEGSTVEEDSMTHYGFFFQDAVTIKERLTLNIGVRYDTSTGRFPEQHHSPTPDPMGILNSLKAGSIAWDEYDFPEYKVTTWSHLSPRIGFSYDVFGDGKTSIRGSWSRYNEYLMIQYFSLCNPMYPSSGSWYWIDDDYDYVVETTDTFVEQYLPVDPTSFVLEDEIDVDSSAPYTDEFTLGIEREMARDLSLGLVFTYKHKQNVFEDVNDFGLGKGEAWKGYRPDSPYWQEFTFNDPGDDGEFGTADDITSSCYAELAGAPATHYWLTNVEGSYRKYWALQFLVNKRMSNRWQLLGSITWSKAWGNIGGDYNLSYGASGTFDTPNSFLYDKGRLNYDRPTNILRKAMGDVPYEAGKYVTASTLETGTLTEKPTEIWVYDNYPEIFSGPLRLVFVDHHGTGEYKLTTSVQITPFSMVDPTWDEPDMAKYQWRGEIEMDGKGYEALAIFDYDVSLETEEGMAGSFVSLSIDVPYSRVGIRQEGENYICDLIISAEVIDSQNLRVSQKGEPFSRTLSKKQLKDMIKNKAQIHKEWNFSLPPGKNLVYINVTDSVRGKKLRKLFHAKGK